MMFGLIYLFASPIFASSEILYDQSAGDNSAGAALSSSRNSFDNRSTITADDFQLITSATITGINWWGRQYDGGEKFQFTFYKDDVTTYDSTLAAPGKVIHTTSGSVVSSLVDVGLFADPITFYSVTLDIPFFMEPGTYYWVSIYNKSSDAVWYWVEANEFGNESAQYTKGNPFGWGVSGADRSFQLVGNTAPEQDIDGDTIHDDIDNCPETYNPDQIDTDGDGFGDACDDDVEDEGPGKTCSDGIDNDGNGDIDCADSGCSKKKHCK